MCVGGGGCGVAGSHRSSTLSILYPGFKPCPSPPATQHARSTLCLCGDLDAPVRACSRVGRSVGRVCVCAVCVADVGARALMIIARACMCVCVCMRVCVHTCVGGGGASWGGELDISRALSPLHTVHAAGADRHVEGRSLAQTHTRRCACLPHAPSHRRCSEAVWPQVQAYTVLSASVSFLT